MLTLNDLSKLPHPTVLEPLSFETLLAQMQSEFQARYPDYSALLASDPAVKLLELAAYRELLLRNRINAAARAGLLAYADAGDLDHLAAFYGVERLGDEDDAALRQRTRLRIAGSATAGGVAHYRYWALTASSAVRDIAVDSPAPGQVRISVLGADGTTSPALLEAVRAAVLREDVRVLTDDVHVLAAELLALQVQADIWLYPDAPLAQFEALDGALRAALAQHARLGWDANRSWLVAQLHRSGVQRVELLQPQRDTVVLPHQAVRLSHLNLRLAGRKH